MRGNPKFEMGDVVIFTVGGKDITGVVVVVDAFGTFQDPSDVNYDIYCENENMLYKHVGEKLVRKAD